MRTQNQLVAVLLALSSLIAIAPAGSSFADTPVPAKEAKAKPQPTQSAEPTQPSQPAQAAAAATKTNTKAARKAAEARMARCRLHPEICVQ
jgi:hypothetical protein